MILSTDTQAQQTASRRPRRPGFVRLGAYGVGVALAVALGALSFADQSTYGAGDRPVSAYARQTPAVRGQTLAAYVAADQDNRLTGRP